MTIDQASARAEEVARASYGRLLAILASKDGDIEAAEDCLADAFAQALSTWPRRGVPDNPEAWILTVARNRRHDVRRSAAYQLTDPIDDVARGRALAATMQEIDPDEIPDRRLALLFVCAHPAIDPAVRTPLMLQTVLGFDADDIGRAFLVPAATMAQRLVRAKRRIRDARIPFAIPERSQMPERLTPVLEAIYGAYAIDFSLVAGASPRESLSAEAHFLATTLAELLADEPEALGLAALLSLSLARRGARDSADEFVPLDEQDASRWDADLIALGERLPASGQHARNNRPVSTRGGDPIGALRAREIRCRRRGRVAQAPRRAGRRLSDARRAHRIRRGRGTRRRPASRARRARRDCRRSRASLSTGVGDARAPARGSRPRERGASGVRSSDLAHDSRRRSPVPRAAAAVTRLRACPSIASRPCRPTFPNLHRHHDSVPDGIDPHLDLHAPRSRRHVREVRGLSGAQARERRFRDS